MSTDANPAAPAAAPSSPLRTVLLALPMLLLTFFFLSGGKVLHEPKVLAAFIITYAFVNVLFILMIHTGKTDRYRAIFFITYAVMFSVSFISHMIEARGAMSVSDDEALAGRVPFCHIVTTMVLIPAALSKTIIFWGSMTKTYASIASMLIIWIGASLALGRGWCSWACFFGGWDDGFSRLRRKAVIRNIPVKWSYLSFAVLIAVALISAAVMEPVYCPWICPFKAVSEYSPVTDVKTAVQAGIFITLFGGLAIVLPVLTRRRMQCSLLCPFGAMQSFTNYVSPYEVRIDPAQCRKCKLCIRDCPTFSLDEKSLEGGGARFTCVKCGKCVDSCPRGATYFHIKGTPLLRNAKIYRMLFLYSAVLFMAVFGGGTVQNAVLRLINLATTGRI